MAEYADPAGALVTLLPPPVSGSATKDSGANPVVVFGRTYTCAVGASIQVPAQDAVVMVANGWTRFGRLSGTTAQRPVPIPPRGVTYFDSTVGHIIVSDGVTWRDHDGSAA
jgi:hypothetical protein